MTEVQGDAVSEGRQTTAARTPRPAPVIWLEVEDLLHHFRYASTVTGIQRVSQEILTEAQRLFGASGRIRFCRMSEFTGRWEAIEWPVVRRTLEKPPGRWAPEEIWASRGAHGGRMRTALAVVRALPRYVRWVPSLVSPALRDRLGGRARHRRFAAGLHEGDVIVALGGPWINPRYVERLAAVKRAAGARFALLVHDVIPLVDPGAFGENTLHDFVAWLGQVVGVCDILLTVSESSRRELVGHAARVGWHLPPVDVLRLGTGFRAAGSAGSARALPPRFVLLVSTVEVRKNHLFLVNVWQRLVERHGASAVPSLVFVGRVGWKVEPLLAALEASRYLDGKVELHSDFTDADVHEAYRRCLFTIYPSRHEGWGLPVAESLSHGKFCISSNSSSLPEVGGDFVDYFDPADEADAAARIERVLFEPGYLAARERQIAAAYRPPSWADCAQMLVAAIDRSRR
jgi:glycosyltransferase involved in cell wall biosynthesis